MSTEKVVDICYIEVTTILRGGYPHSEILYGQYASEREAGKNLREKGWNYNRDLQEWWARNNFGRLMEARIKTHLTSPRNQLPRNSGVHLR